MSREQTAEGVEAEAARVRSQLMDVGADLRRRTDPSAITEAATATINERAKVVPGFLKAQSSPIGLIVLGVALGAVATSAFAKSPSGARAGLGAASPTSGSSAAAGFSARVSAPKPTFRQQAQAALLSAAGIGLGYVAGMFVPKTELEDTYLAAPKAVLREHLNEFVEANTKSMKMSALNLFGASRLSATGLIGLAVVAQFLTAQQPKAKSGRA